MWLWYMSCWLGTLLSGLNFRKYHGFSSEDWIGQLKHCCWASQHASLEEFALKRWYTGFLGKVWVPKVCSKMSKPGWCPHDTVCAPKAHQ